MPMLLTFDQFALAVLAFFLVTAVVKAIHAIVATIDGIRYEAGRRRVARERTCGCGCHSNPDPRTAHGPNPR